MNGIRLHGLVNDAIVDGQGLRLAVFVQGCSRNCDGCHNPESQPFNGGTVWSVSDVMERITPITQGVTLTGGEPFEQPQQCLEIARAAHEMDLDVWAYTGFLFEELCDDAEKQRLLTEIDVLVDGAFIKELSSYALKWRGSSNQRIINVKASFEKNEVVLWGEE